MAYASLRRVDFGYFVRPAEETDTGRSRVEPCLGYLVVHPDGLLLFDTGMGSHPDVDAHYRPRRLPLEAALAAAGTDPDDIRLVANCHLHFDHCGGNPELTGRPVLTQARELADARATEDYTLPHLLDAPGTVYDELTGHTEVLSGVFLTPTPGHTDGHQSLVVRRDDGMVVVAGQSHDTATEFSADALSVQANRAGHRGAPRPSAAWVDSLLQLDPSRVYFAHDHAVWMP